MLITASGVFLIFVFGALALRGWSTAIPAAAALIPFAAAAAFVLVDFGGLNVVVAHFAFSILVGVWLVRDALLRGVVEFPGSYRPVKLYAAILLYGLFSAVLMPFLFQGDVWVVSLDRGAEGMRISSLFRSSLSELRPSSGNISQSFYLTLGFAILLFLVVQARKLGVEILDRAVLAAAIVNISLGLLDILDFDGLLAVFHSGNYNMHLEGRIFGIERVVGGATEASRYGFLASVFFAYFLSRYLDSRRGIDRLVAFASGFTAVLSLSSTGFVGIAAVLFFLAARIVWTSFYREARRDVFYKLALLAGAVLLVLLIALLSRSSAALVIVNFLQELIFDKASSNSGLERGTWALRGLQIGLETYGLGAGLGSTRSNGLVSLWVSNLGLPGLILFALFVLSLLRVGPGERINQGDLTYFRASWLALLTAVTMDLASATVIAPSLMFILLAAISISSRQPAWSQAPVSRVRGLGARQKASRRSVYR